MMLGLLTTPIITRIVSPDEYGQLSLFTMYSGIAVMILCAGLDQALVRYFYEKKEVEYKRALLFKCIQLPVIVTIFLGLVVIFLKKTNILNFEFDFFVTILLCIYVPIQLIYRFSQLLVRLDYNSKLYSFLNVLSKVLYVLFALSLVMIIRKDYFSLLAISYLMAYFICMVMSIVAQSNTWNFFKVDKAVCHISSRELYKYGFPYIFSLGITTFFQAIDRISLNMYCSYSEVGIYASATSIINIFAIVQTTFNALWGPMAVEHYTNNPEDKSFYQKGNRIITLVMFFIGFSLIFCKDLVALLLGAEYREAAYIVPFLVFNPIMYTISETTVSGLVFKKKSKVQIIISLGACLTNIIGNILLVPSLGSKGAAISTGISYIVFFTLRTVLSNRYFKVDYKLTEFYIITAVAVIYAFYNTFTIFNAITVAFYIGCLLLLALLYKEEVKWSIAYAKKQVMSVLNH